MNKINIFYVALATMTLATSCSQDELQSSKAAQSEISFHANMGLKSRAEETDLTKLQSSCFYVSSFVTNATANYMKDVKYTYSTQWNSPTGETYFWPVSETLNFYAYAYGHEATQTALSGVTISSTTQEIKDFSPATDASGEDGSKADASKQEDLIYAAVSGNKDNNSSGITLTFNHALSEISVKALNSNTAYKVTVKRVKLGNIINKNTFTFPTASSGSASTNGTWGTSTEKGNYETHFDGITLSSTEQFVDNEKPFMLIPQQCEKGKDANQKSKYSAGHYIALYLSIEAKNGDSYEGGASYTGWAYVGIDTNWEQGKHYTYVLDFSKGAGQDENGNQIISGSEINISSVEVTKITDGTTTTNMTGVESDV